jgi:hypothetical protein
MSIKKFKREKVKEDSNVAKVQLNAPIQYVEEVIPFNTFPNGTTVIDEIMEPEYVLPFGYPTEQFFGMLKNEILRKQAEIADRNQKTTFTSTFSAEDDDPNSINSDIDIVLFSKDIFHKEYQLKAFLSKKLLSNWKLLFRECLQVRLRMKEGFNITPEKLVARITDVDPITEVNPKGFNPCLERRIDWQKRILMNEKSYMYINKNFIVEHKLLRHAFDCSINKVTNK